MADYDRINFFYGFSNNDTFLYPWYSSGVAYDKLLPINGNIPALMYGYPLPVVPVKLILYAIDKVYGTDFKSYCHDVEFGETDISGTLLPDGYVRDLYGQLVLMAQNYVPSIQEQIQAVFNSESLNPIYDLGVVPCTKSQYKSVESEGETRHITSATFVPTYETGFITNLIKLETTQNYGRLFDIIDGVIYINQPGVRLRITGNISFTARSKTNTDGRLKDDLSSVKVVLKYREGRVNTITGESEYELGASDKPISYKRYSTNNPTVVASPDGTVIEDVHRTYFPLTNWVISEQTEYEWRTTYKFGFIFDNKEDESFEAPSGRVKTDTRGYWLYPNANEHYKIVTPRMVGLGNSVPDNRVYLALDFDADEFEDISIVETDITIEPFFEGGGMPHSMCPVYSLPDMPCIDFIKGLMITEGCYMYKDEAGVIRKKPFTTLLDNIKSCNSYNIEPIKDSITIDVSSGLAQKNIFMSASDSDKQEETDETSEEGYANNLLISKIDNKQINEKQIISTNPFYPPFLKDPEYPYIPTGNCVKNWEISNVLAFRPEADGEVSQVGAELEGIEGKPSIWTLKLGTGTGYAHVVSDEYGVLHRYSNARHDILRLELKEIPTFRFKNNPNYKMLKRIIELGIAIKCKCVLSIEDTFDIDWTKPVYIDRLNSYFLLVSVSWSSTDNVSELEMLKIPADIIIEDNENE